MFDVILACTENFGIGLRGGLPWKCKQEMAIFNIKTSGHILIFGRKTAENLPVLCNRVLILISKKSTHNSTNSSFVCIPSIDEALEFSRSEYPDKKIFIGGGASIYNEVLNNKKYLRSINRLHISIFGGRNISCDTFINFPGFSSWVAEEESTYDDFKHYEMSFKKYSERQYLDVLGSVFSKGDLSETRNGKTYSSFVKNLTFDLRGGFPLLTCKKMFFRGIVEELLFFLRGDTDTSLLENRGVKIWSKNTSEEFLNSRGLEYKKGLMGPMYGYQWRFFNKKYNGLTGAPGGGADCDQLERVINTIKNDPASRRIIMTSYNPAQSEGGVLYPCHSISVQFYVKMDGGEPRSLSMYCFNRSSDLVLGLPFNIASSALLLTIVAKMTGLEPKYLHIALGDAHIYFSHKDAVLEQLSGRRSPLYSFPTLEIKREGLKLGDVPSLTFADFSLENYRCHPEVKAGMVA